MFPLADQQELHGRPIDAAMAQHVDQVDQHAATAMTGRPQSSMGKGT